MAITDTGSRTDSQTELPVDPQMDSPESITRLLIDAQAGEDGAWTRIYGLLYGDLHRIARAQIRQRMSGRISATSLVSESWLRLSGAHFNVENRRHFTALVARAMRFVLMDEVRRDLAEGPRIETPHRPEVRRALADLESRQVLISAAYSRMADASISGISMELKSFFLAYDEFLDAVHALRMAQYSC